MRPRCVVGVTLLVVNLLTLRSVAAQIVVSSPAQTAPQRDRVLPPRVGTSALKGRVVDAATGAPIPRARVRIQGGGGGPRPSVLTDRNGRFVFANLPAGAYQVTADKSTYMSGRYPDQGRTMRSNMKPLMLTDGTVLDNVTVSMYHGASISGRVVDAYGDAVEFAEVRVMRMTAGRSPTMRTQSQTNDLGEFRVPRLDPGNYIVHVSPRRMGQEEPVTEGQAPAQPLPTYFPNAMSLDEAQPIELTRGQSVSGVEVVLGEGYAATLVGTVINSEGQPAGNGFVNARTILKGLPTGVFEGGGTGLRPDGTFRMQLPPGEYVIEAHLSAPFVQGQPQKPESERSGFARVSLAASTTENVSIVVGRGATASGRVVFEGSTPPPPLPTQPIFVPFNNSEGQFCRSGQAQIAADWTFRIEGLAGTCSGPVAGVFGRWTLKAVMMGGENLLERKVTFEPGQSLSDVQLVFTDKRTDLSFRVSDERGESTREYVAIVFATDKSRWIDNTRYLTAYAPPSRELLESRMGTWGSANGATPSPTVMEQMRREAVIGLPAGDYYVVAVDDIEAEASRDPRILEQLAASATRVTISEDAPNEVALRRFKLSELVR